MNLSDAEIQQLNYERFYHPCPLVRKRFQAIYCKAAHNFPIDVVAKSAGLHPKTVYRFLNDYQSGGLESLRHFNYGTNRSELDRFAEPILLSFYERPPMNAKEAQSRIHELTGIQRGLTQVQKFMKRHGLSYLKTGHIPAKVDAHQQEQWLENTLAPAIEQAQNEECVLLFMDAAHFVLQPFICALWCLKRLFIKASPGRNRINVLGVVNAITKEVITFSNTTFINAPVIVEFLEQLRRHYPEKTLKIVLDNARYQHCKLVKEAAIGLDIELLFLPPYSPNLNIIERLWKFTKKTILHAKYYDSPAKFHEAITEFFSTINSNHHESLEKFLTLNFQKFDQQNSLIYPV